MQDRSSMEAPRERRRAPPAVRIPHDPIGEQVILAAVLADKDVADRLLPTILPDLFHAKGHAAAWTALREMQRKGLLYDPATVAQISGGAVDVDYLEQLLRDRPVAPPNLNHTLSLLHWDHARVEAAQGPLSELLEALKDPTTPPDQVRAIARQLSEAFTGHGTDGYLRTTAQVVAEHRRVLTQRREGIACYEYGIPGLDFYGEDEDHEDAGFARMIPGAAPGRTTLITGVSGSGKSTITASMAVAWAEMGRRVCFAAWEQGEAMTLELCATLSLGWDRTYLMRGQYTAEQQLALEQEMERLGEHIKFFRLPFGRARGEKHYNDKALDLIQSVIADSRAEVFVADLMRRALKETDPDDEEQAIFRLQAMAEEQQVHHVWLHQIRLKELETRKVKWPTRDVIKGSAAWVEAPDTIIAWHRDALFKTITDDKLLGLVLKMRFGVAPLAVEFDWEPRYGRVSGGRSIDFIRTGEDTEVDSFLAEAMGPPRRGRGNKRS